MSLFRDSRSEAFTELAERFYRIDEQELQQFFQVKFRVRIVQAHHQFLDKSIQSRLGGSGAFDIYNTTTQVTVPDAVPEGIALNSSERSLTFTYRTSTQYFCVTFDGPRDALTILSNAIKRNERQVLVCFFYIFNRFRAAAALERKTEEDRQRIIDITAKFRRKDQVDTALKGLLELVRCDHVMISLTNYETRFSYPIAFSTHVDHKFPLPLAHDNLSVYGNTIAKANTLEYQELEHIDVSHCNCQLFKERGAKLAAYISFGPASPTDKPPRGILCLYRNNLVRLTPAEKILVLYLARDIAGWIDELDEDIEREITMRSLLSVDKQGSAAARNPSDTNQFSMVLESIETALTQLLPRYLQVLPTNAKIHVGLYSDEHVIWGTPISHAIHFKDSVPEVSETLGRKSSLILLRVQGIHNSKNGLLIASESHLPSLLRKNLLEYLVEISAVLNHILSVDAKRRYWMARIIHEVRQPLHLLVFMANDLRRQIELPDLSRREVAHFAEDMELSIMRIKILLWIFDDFSKLDTIHPMKRPMLLEADVLRPIRRLLTAAARQKNIEIKQAVAYETITELYSDPDLLALVFYNLYDNALKYSQPFSHVDVFCSKDSQNFYIEMTSRGYHIADDEREKIFEDGYRGRAVRTLEVGLGLGLNFVARILKNIGMSIALTNCGELGSDGGKVSFTITIPKRGNTI